MTYPHKMPVAMQAATIRAAVVLGPTQGFARAPLWMAVGRVRPADDLAALHEDADALDDLFRRCPVDQWPAAAQAGMA